MEELILKIARDPTRQSKRREALSLWKESNLPTLKKRIIEKQSHPTSTNTTTFISLSVQNGLNSNSSASTFLNTTSSSSTSIDNLDVNMNSTNPSEASSSSYSSTSTSSSSSAPLTSETTMELDSLDQFMANVNSEVEKIQAEEQQRLADLQRSQLSLKSKSHQSEGPSSSQQAETHVSSSFVDSNTTGLPSTGLSSSHSKGLSTQGKTFEHKEKEMKMDDRSHDEEEEEEIEDMEDEEEDILAYAAKKLAKKKDVQTVDHSTIVYAPFRKDFYIEPPELAELDAEEVKKLRQELGGIRVVGKDCPKPAKKWTHCGLAAACSEVIKKLGFPSPTSIQAQAIPAIMSGRDVIGVAKTGSGKTLAFLLPLFRHVKDQPPLSIGEGPIALIMTPTRELAMQIYKEAKLFCKPLGLRSACCYGGSPISDQIAELKRGVEIIVCTPGRMIDLLCANAGRVTNLRRVTYLVLDEADRMFDMGFEPQVMKIVNNVRPMRQTVLFSATFPKQMEALARKILQRPLEITVGLKSVVATDVLQLVEVREEQSKFLRLLDILGKAFSAPEEPRVLIFVDRQEAADHLMSHLMKRSYVCNSLHGGKDQMDRDITLMDFKAGNVPILIATSVAARGLDVKGLNLVINFDCPNHKEDYIHRVGRTGRAGNKGTAYTFITPEQERYAPDIMEALKASKADIPEALLHLAQTFKEKVKAGQAQSASKGFGGKGLEKLDKERESLKKVQKLSHGVVDEDEEVEDEAEPETPTGLEGLIDLDDLPPTNVVNPSQTIQSKDGLVLPGLPPTVAKVPSSSTTTATTTASTTTTTTTTSATTSSSTSSTETVVSTTTSTTVPPTPSNVPAKPALSAGAARAQDIIQQLNLQIKAKQQQANAALASSHTLSYTNATNHSLPPLPPPLSFASSATTTTTTSTASITTTNSMSTSNDLTASMNSTTNATAQAPSLFNYTCEFEINDYPQRARWKVTNKDQINQICDLSGAAITTRGSFFASGKLPKEGERKLYLFIEGETQLAVDKAKLEIARILKEATLATVEMELKSGGISGRYSVV